MYQNPQTFAAQGFAGFVFSAEKGVVRYLSANCLIKKHPLG
jgi:hypothetical protein